MSSVQMDIEWYTNLHCTRPACELSDTQSDATHSAGVITPAFHTVKYPRTKPGVPLGCHYFHIFPTLDDYEKRVEIALSLVMRRSLVLMHRTHNFSNTQHTFSCQHCTVPNRTCSCPRKPFLCCRQRHENCATSG
uniref:Uncharacterized protein n=1 Tax=Ixodes ricinus TaxID=34613 RepID=A0A131Y9L8_IXORI